MLKKVLLLLSIILSVSFFAQDYAYSFEGDIQGMDWSRLEASILKVHQVREVKIKTKPDSDSGQLLIFIKPASEQRSEGNSSFNPSDVKSILIDFGLEPLRFTSLKN